MARQQAVQLQVRPVAVDLTGQEHEQNIIRIEAAPTDTLRDVEEAVKDELKKMGMSPQPDKGFRWMVVTASGEETPVSNTTTIRQIVDMYQPQELKLLFDAGFG